MTQETLINRIAYFRKLKGFTQKDLSVAVGANVNYINRLESKKDFFPSAEMLFKILNALDVEPEMFFATDFAHCVEHRQLIEASANLSESAYSLLLSDGGPEIINALVSTAYSVGNKLNAISEVRRHVR